MSSIAKVEWGVRLPDGRIEVMDSASANEVYMTPEELARVRANRIDGQVVSRIRKVSYTHWKDEPRS